MPLKTTQVERKTGCFEVCLSGRLDGETSPQLQSVLRMLFECRVLSLQLNFRELDYISSAGLRVVLQAMKQAKAAKAVFMAAEMQAPVKKVFEIAQLVPMESIFASVKEADAYFDEMQKRVRQQPEG